MPRKKFSLSDTKVIKNLEKTLQDFHNPDCSQMKIFPFFTDYSDTAAVESSPEDIIECLEASQLNLETLIKYERYVKDATLSFSKDNKIRIIDDANNLIILQGAIRQPFKSEEDIFCRVTVNHKVTSSSREIYENIISHLKGNCLILR